MYHKSPGLPLHAFFVFTFISFFLCTQALNDVNDNISCESPVLKRHRRTSLLDTEFGRISAVQISDGTRSGTQYYLQFITLEPNSVFLPVLLHADMVFFVHTGSGRLIWAHGEDEDDNKVNNINVKRGDVYRLRPGSVFYMESSLEMEREKLRIYAIFSNTGENLFDPAIGAYSSIRNLILGFDGKTLQSAFKVPPEAIESLKSATRPPLIIHGVPKKKDVIQDLESRFLKLVLGSRSVPFNPVINSKKKKNKAYNILDEDPDFKNCNGWSLSVDGKAFSLLRGSSIGVFYVNLTKGSMMGPHWNPMATEISVVLQGRGMIRVVCPSTAIESECQNMIFEANEGDVFLVPRFHPMAQMSFNNESFVFLGFSTTTRRNYPQFLAGKRSFLQTLDKQILALSFNVSNATMEQILSPQEESLILDCTSCAEEELIKEREEIERRRQEEEARKREEEEERRREEEEERRREEEERRREEEERRKEEEEEAARREEERRRQEEEARRREEEQRREEEEARRREEEQRRQEEETKRQQQEQERQQEEQRRREEAAKREQEEARRQEEERERRAREEAEEEARQKREEQEGQPEGEGERQQREEERQQEEQRRREEAKARQQEEARRQEEEERERQARQEEEEERERQARQEEEEERERQARQEEEEERERQARQEEEARQDMERQQQEEERRREEAAAREQEEARRQEEERERQAREQEGQGGGWQRGAGQQGGVLKREAEMAR